MGDGWKVNVTVQGNRRDLCDSSGLYLFHYLVRKNVTIGGNWFKEYF